MIYLCRESHKHIKIGESMKCEKERIHEDDGRGGKGNVMVLKGIYPAFNVCDIRCHAMLKDGGENGTSC